jgi:hypothetical protein
VADARSHQQRVYRDLLGFTVGLQIEGFVVHGDPTTPTLALGTHSQVHGRNLDPARHMVGLSADDIDAEWKRLKAAGVEFVEDPTDYGTLRIATLKDPEGNRLIEPEVFVDPSRRLMPLVVRIVLRFDRATEFLRMRIA